MKIIPGIKNSYEKLFHLVAEQCEFKDFCIIFRTNELNSKEKINKEIIDILSKPRYERFYRKKIFFYLK